MKKQVIKDIKEIIEFLLNVREQQFIQNEESSFLVNSFPEYEENNFNLAEENSKTSQRFDERLITLNKLLKKEEQNKSVLDIEAEMRKIEVKSIINVKEYTEKYGDSDTAQKNDRGLVKNSLPYNQKVKGGKITYTVEKVEEWRELYAYKRAGKVQ